MAALNAAAPRITDRLCDACAEHFAAVRAHLDALGVPYRLEPGLVRGLDYYTRTAFEFYIAGREGQQQALGGGGRYDGLVELLGGRPTPGIGFGIGLDRLVLALAETGVAGAAGAGAGRGRRRRRPGRHGRPGCGSPRTCGRRASRPAPTSPGASSASSSRRPPGTSAHFAVIVGDELGDRQRSACATCRPAPRSSSPLADLAREIARAHGAHRHG